MSIKVQKSQIGDVIIEGKTKKVFRLVRPENKSNISEVYVLNKDRITAGDGVKAHELKDKGRLSTQTNCAVFNYLNAVGVKTHFVGQDADNVNGFVAQECDMIPIEWVSRRVATGSYLRRNPTLRKAIALRH